jgi:UDP-N-acetylglucosamine 2-epimerase (non-hydrolysing)/GDP/UDP-N,N'-diacetylbacillosamine 2-epimerase (hydrolysing)
MEGAVAEGKMSKRKICVVTGSRAEYGLLRPVMEKIKDSDTLCLQVLVTGMHLLPEFGYTINEIRKDGFKIDAEVPVVLDGDTKKSMVTSIGVGIIGFNQALSALNPDIVLILGDRYEIFAAAIAASYSGKVVAHISGGDKSKAGYDEYTRHAITKISHIHFPSTAKSAERIKKLGEDKKYIFTVGSTSLDTILNKKFKTREQVFKQHGLNYQKRAALLIQHPLSTNPQGARREMQMTLESILELRLQCIVICPNVDPGGKQMKKVINRFAEEFPDLIRAYDSLPFEDYLNIMKNVDVMLGNSSSGIIESAAFRLPVINIGTRQEGRERSQNIIDVPYEKKKIKKAIEKALYDKDFQKKIRKCKSPFGYGRASERIVKVLSKIKIDKILFNKKISY